MIILFIYFCFFPTCVLDNAKSPEVFSNNQLNHGRNKKRTTLLACSAYIPAHESGFKVSNYM